jgi:hypothetical protein
MKRLGFAAIVVSQQEFDGVDVDEGDLYRIATMLRGFPAFLTNEELKGFIEQSTKGAQKQETAPAKETSLKG